MYGQLAMIIGLISMLGWAAHSWKVQIETNYAVKLQGALAEQALEFQKATAETTGKIADDMRDKDIDALKNKHTADLRIRELSLNLERMAHEQPFKASNLYEYNVRHIMCFISKGGDTAGRESCNRFEAVAENYTPELAAFITVTRETTDYWNEQCDEGVKSFCDYAIMGITQRGSIDLLTDLKEIDYYQLRLNHSEDAKIEALKYLRDVNIKNLEKKQ